MQDTAGNLNRIIKTIDDIEKNEKGQNDSFSHTCIYIKAREAERMLKDLLGDPRVAHRPDDAGDAAATQTAERPAAIAAGAGRPTRSSACTTSPSDERLNTVLVSGPADKIAQAREIMKKIDVPQPGQKPIDRRQPGVEDLPGPGRSAADVAKTLQDDLQNSNTVQVTAGRHELVMVYAPPEDQMEIAHQSAARRGRRVHHQGDAADDPGSQRRRPDAQGHVPRSARTGIGPYIEGDTTRNAIILKGTAEQVADVETALKAIGEAGRLRQHADHHSTRQRGQLAANLQRLLEQSAASGQGDQADRRPTRRRRIRRRPAAEADAPTPGSGNGGGDRRQPPPRPPPAAEPASRSRSRPSATS